METIKFKSDYFNIVDTLFCGQVFRFKPFKKGFLITSKNESCYLYENLGYFYLESEHADYFYNYFDLDKDYEKINSEILNYNDEFLTKIASLGKGIRILKQDLLETAISFIISQNNNVKRIQLILENLSKKAGERYEFMGEEYYAFPTLTEMKNLSVKDFKDLGLGYRSEYLYEFIKKLSSGYDLERLKSLDTQNLTSELLKIKGIGKKVADCITFFGYGRTDSFPVDTWIEKIYVENFKGTEKDRVKISKNLVEKFGKLSGYVQQYAFYYKRSLEKK